MLNILYPDIWPSNTVGKSGSYHGRIPSQGYRKTTDLSINVLKGEPERIFASGHFVIASHHAQRLVGIDLT